MQLVMVGVVVLLVGTASAQTNARPKDAGEGTAAEKAIYKDWARLNRQVYQQYGKKLTTYFSNLEKRSKAFCKTYKLTPARLEQVVQAGVREKWPTEEAEDATLARKYVEEVEATRDRNVFQAEMLQAIREEQARRDRNRLSSSGGGSLSANQYESSVKGVGEGPVTARDIEVNPCGAKLEDGETCRRMVPGIRRPCWRHRR